MHGARREERERRRVEKRAIQFGADFFPTGVELTAGLHYNRVQDFTSIRMRGAHVKYYCIVELDTTDPSWVPAYVQNVTKLVEQRGGRYLARTSMLEKIEGQRALPQILVLLEWPSKESAMAFYESEEYRPYRESRIAGGKNEFLLAAGEDIARVAHIAG